MAKPQAAAPILALLLVGCFAPTNRLSFPPHATKQSIQGIFYNLHSRRHPDFALLPDERGRLDVLAYDDNGDGAFDRLYRLHDYSNDSVPHLIVLLDSIPYAAVDDWYRRGQFPYFDPPQKVIPPFPSLTELCYTTLLHAPPLPGMVDTYFDRDAGATAGNIWRRTVQGYREPWERRLHYAASSYETALTYLDPRPWFAAELARAKRAVDESPDRVTLVYITSASAMLSKYGRRGLDEVLAGVQRLCMQVLYERQGAIKIALLADHGHNLTPSQNVSLSPWLEKAGFHVGEQLHDDRDVVVELLGLVTYAGIDTRHPAEVARAVCACPQVQFAAYLDRDRIVVRDANGSSTVECRAHQFRYDPIDADVLRYAALMKAMPGTRDGYAPEDSWFSFTLDHAYPDGPRRLWNAFHGQVVHPPDVMVVLRDGYCAGDPSLERFIHMASTHGGLNQSNSATFVMTMTGRTHAPLATKDVLQTIEPGYVSAVR